MAQSLSKIYLHIIFHTKTTSPVVQSDHIPRLHAYIGQLIKSTGCYAICVGGTENHIHALVQLSPTETVAHLLEEMKRNSSRWIKTLSPIYEKFAWQGGYAVFSVSQSLLDRTIEYIRNQVEHHKKQSFKEEYLEFLRLYKIDFDERYVFSD
jgi:REP element-mobilizing transposase RayT